MRNIALIIAVCCLMAGCATSRPIPVNQTLTASEEEQMLWRRAQEEQEAIEGSGLLYQDPDIENYLCQIAKKLQTNAILPDISFQIKVIKDPKLNAFALPNGVIYIHTGILAHMENEAQLAALLAHEMTHCTHQHSLKTLRNIRNRTQATSATIPELAQLLGITGTIASINGYRNELETEADRVGLDLAVKANYDPNEVLKLFELLKQENEIEGVAEPHFFGTRPKVQQRIENVNRWLAENHRGKIKGSKNTIDFQSRMSPVMLVNARLDLQRGKFSIAQGTVKKYLNVNPDDAQAYYLLGEIFRQRGWKNDSVAAINYYEKSISLNPSFAESYKAMGLIHYKDGEKQRAKKYFESCLLLSPKAADQAYIQRYLKMCAANGE
ncbi:MAG: M48 family metalloprotease [Desulfobacterales bacterium]|jgi:predicted Zn-dependent protease